MTRLFCSSGKLRLKFRNILIRQAAALAIELRNSLVFLCAAAPLFCIIINVDVAFEGGQPLNLVQLVHLARQPSRVSGEFRSCIFTHQRLIRRHPAGMRRKSAGNGSLRCSRSICRNSLRSCAA